MVGLVWWREREPPVLGELAELAEEQQPGRARTPAVALALALVGVAVMLAGGELAVRGAVRVVDSLGRSDSAVGLTVLALATTAELFALVLTAMRHDVPEVAVAGVVGSAAYNATATLGAAALVAPLAVDGVIGSALAAAALPVVVLALAPAGRLGRAAGLALLAGYASYVLLVLA
jgi:cation:H+ antiporter